MFVSGTLNVGNVGCDGSEMVASDNQEQDIHNPVGTEHSTARGDHQHHACLSYRSSGRSPGTCIYIEREREREKIKQRKQTLDQRNGIVV